MYDLYIKIGAHVHKVECIDLLAARMMWDFIHAQERKPSQVKLTVEYYVTNNQLRP